MNGILRTLMFSLFATAIGLHAFGLTKILEHCHGHEGCCGKFFLHDENDEPHDCHEYQGAFVEEDSHDNEHEQKEPTHHYACSFCKQLQGVAILLLTFRVYPPLDFRIYLRWVPMMPESPVLERDIPPMIA
jgi:hypothetical protein